MVKRVMAHPERRIAREVVIRVPGMFGGRLFVAAVFALPHQTVVLNVVHRFEDDVRANDLAEIEQQALRARKPIQRRDQDHLPQRKAIHAVA